MARKPKEKVRQRTDAEVEALVSANLPLVHYMAAQFYYVDPHEALSAALDGLWLAAQKWDAGRKVPFGSYASKYIRWQLGRVLKPRQTVKRGRDYQTISLHGSVSKTGDLENGDLIPDEDIPMAFQAQCDEELRRLVSEEMARLTDREVEVLSRRFGLNGHAREGLREIGDRLGLSNERIRQIQEAALEKLGRRIRKE